MAIHMRRQRLGCAYYDAYHQRLHVSQDVKVEQLAIMIATICQQACPSVVLISSIHKDSSMERALQAQELQVRIQPRSAFHMASAKARLLALPWIASISQLSNILCFDDDELAIICAGVLLSHSNSMLKCPANYLAVDLLPVQAIERFSIGDGVYVSATTMRGLQIMTAPISSAKNVFNRGHHTLLNLLNFTNTSAGYHKLKAWISRPISNKITLVMRQQAIKELLMPERECIVQQLNLYLKRLGNMQPVLKSLHNKLQPNDWVHLYKFIHNCREISAVLDDWHITARNSLIMEIRSTLCFSSLNQFYHVIDSVLDVEATQCTNQMVVKLHVDRQLDQLRHLYIGLEDFLQHAARSLQTEWRPILSDIVDCLNIAYFPYLGYLVAIPSQYTISTRQQTNIGLEKQFELEAVAYFKSQQMLELDTHIGDVLGKITDIEIKIFMDLQNYVIQHQLLLYQAEEACSTLDCLLSLSEAARSYHFTCPALSTNVPQLVIKQGWHPLYSMSTEGLISNDLNVPELQQRVSLLTGPNASGKTTFISQVALAVYMAHIGSFVPAKKATIGLTNAIFACILTLDSLSKAESAFMMDIEQIAMALKHATAKSLVIIDEFGQGTLYSDGVALCAAVLHQFAYQENGPIVIATTHFQEIYSSRLLVQAPISHLSMATIQQDSKIVYLYRVATRKQNASYALETAQQLELPDRIIKNAKLVMAQFAKNTGISNVQLADPVNLVMPIKLIMLKADFDDPTMDIAGFLQWLVHNMQMIVLEDNEPNILYK
ncbi:muts domain V-domain-containing protein [Syncephalis fuscata]|nr:muts domain V-domain-containing protein [Syncephalis fuscata]